MDEGISTKYLEEKYRNALCDIQDAVDELKKSKELPKKFKFDPKKLDELEDLLPYDIDEYVLDLISTVREIEEIKSYLFGYGLRDSDWANGTLLLYTYSLRDKLFTICTEEVTERIPDDIRPYVRLDIEKLVDEREGDYVQVSFRDYELNWKIQ